MNPRYALIYARLIVKCSDVMAAHADARDNTYFGILSAKDTDAIWYQRYNLLRDYLILRLERNVEASEKLKQQNPHNL